LPFRPLWDLKDEGLRKGVSLVAPIILGLSISQINAILLPRSMASLLPAGGTTAIEYANRLMQLPVALFASGMAIALLPSLSALAARSELGRVRAAVAQATRVVVLLAIPSTVLLIVLRVPVIRLVLEHGDFARTDTVAVAGALLFYSFGIIGMSVQQVVSRGFYAVQDTRTPVLLGIVSIAVFFTSAHFLVHLFAERGLALSASIAALVNAILLLVALRKRFHGLEFRRLGRLLWRCLLAAAACGWTARAASGWLSTRFPSVALTDESIVTFGSLVVGVGAYLGIVALLRVEELELVVSRVLRRYRRTAPDEASPSP